MITYVYLLLANESVVTAFSIGILAFPFYSFYCSDCTLYLHFTGLRTVQRTWHQKVILSNSRATNLEPDCMKQFTLRDRALFTCGDGPVHGYFFLPNIFMSIHLIFKKSLCPALVCLKKVVTLPINLIVYTYNIVNIYRGYV